MNAGIKLKFFLCEIAAWLKQHYVAAIVSIAFMAAILVDTYDRAFIDRQCTAVNFTEFQVVDSGEGSSLVARFEFEGQLRRVGVPKNIVKQKGMHYIFKTKTHLFEREYFQFPFYGECDIK